MAAKGPGPRPRGDYPTFKDVAKAVRRYRPSDLLPALARVSAAISDRDENSLEVWVSQASPWGLAALARESLTGGSEDRRHKRVDQADVLALHAMFAASYDESPDDETKSVLSIMTRHAYEQFPYQESDWDEVARTFALLDGALRASSTTTLTVGTLENMLGGQLDVVLRAAVILWGAAKESSGAWDPRWIYSTEASELVEKTPADAVTALAVKLTSTMQAMRRDAVAVPAPAPHLRRYAYNPLQSTPIVKLQRGALILPQTRMVLRRLSPGGLFYEGMRTLGPNFANDLGKVVETYVGQVLALVTGASVHPEVPYAKGSLSVDWFLVMDDLVVLVESKSMRATLGARAGDVDLIPSLQEKLNHALEQLDRSAGLLETDSPALRHIPRDRPMVGVVVTAEPLYIINSPDWRQQLTPARIPTLFMSLRDLERMVLHDAVDLAPALKRIANDPELSTIQFTTALSKVLPEPAALRNPLLADATERLAL